MIGDRIVGREDSDAGQYGLGLMREKASRPYAILRKNRVSGELLSAKESKGFQVIGQLVPQ